MTDLCPEVRDFVRACEVIQGKLAQGGTLTPDEKGVVEISAIELLSQLAQE
jgi:hypothetical protein